MILCGVANGLKYNNIILLGVLCVYYRMGAYIIILLSLFIVNNIIIHVQRPLRTGLCPYYYYFNTCIPYT